MRFGASGRAKAADLRMPVETSVEASSAIARCRSVPWTRPQVRRICGKGKITRQAFARTWRVSWKKQFVSKDHGRVVGKRKQDLRSATGEWESSPLKLNRSRRFGQRSLGLFGNVSGCWKQLGN